MNCDARSDLRIPPCKALMSHTVGNSSYACGTGKDRGFAARILFGAVSQPHVS